MTNLSKRAEYLLVSVCISLVQLLSRPVGVTFQPNLSKDIFNKEVGQSLCVSESESTESSFVIGVTLRAPALKHQHDIYSEFDLFHCIAILGLRYKNNLFLNCHDAFFSHTILICFLSLSNRAIIK